MVLFLAFRRALDDARIRLILPALMPKTSDIQHARSEWDAICSALKGMARTISTPKAPADDVSFESEDGVIVQNYIKARYNISYTNYTHIQPLTMLNKILFGHKSWVDIIENDTRNILWNGRRRGLRLSTTLWISKLLQKWVPWNNLASVSDECYIAQMAPWNKWPTYISNLNFNSGTSQSISVLPTVARRGILLTGTIGQHYGGLTALDWCARLGVQLKAVGYSPSKHFANSFSNHARELGLSVNPPLPRPVPHAEVLKAIAEAEWLLLPYHLSPAVTDCIPVKLYEAWQAGTAVILPDGNPAWERFCRARVMHYSTLSSFPLEGKQAALTGVKRDWHELRQKHQERFAKIALHHLAYT